MFQFELGRTNDLNNVEETIGVKSAVTANGANACSNHSPSRSLHSHVLDFPSAFCTVHIKPSGILMMLPHVLFVSDTPYSYS